MLSSGVQGAEIGSALGSIVPGVGTILGGAAGALIGGISGGLKAKKTAREEEDAKRVSDREELAESRLNRLKDTTTTS